jgi:ABC-type transport system involved in multi-copper enzyme maturation permease subunit
MGYHCPEQYNPADYVMDLVNQDMKVREELKEAYLQNRITANQQVVSVQLEEQQQQNNSAEARQYLIGEPSGNEADLTNPDNVNLIPTGRQGKWPIGFLPQMLILFSRSFRLSGKSQFSYLNFAEALGLAVISGLCWLRMEFAEDTIPDRSSFIFFIMTFWPFQTLMGSLMSFPSERAVIEKERASGSFRLSAYFIAKSLAEAPIKLVLPTLFLIIAYWMARINNNFGIFLGIVFFQLLSILVAESIGLFLGATFRNLHYALICATVVLIGLMLVGGFFIKHLPTWLGVWTPWLSFFKYAYSACLRLQFMGDQSYRCVDGSYVTLCRTNPNGTFTGADALEYFDAGLDVGYDFLVLFFMFILFRVGAYLSLRFIKNTDGRT